MEIGETIADATAVRLLLAEKEIVSHEDFVQARSEVLKYLDRRSEERAKSEHEQALEDLLKSFEGPIQ